MTQKSHISNVVSDETWTWYFSKKSGESVISHISWVQSVESWQSGNKYWIAVVGVKVESVVIAEVGVVVWRAVVEVRAWNCVIAIAVDGLEVWGSRTCSCWSRGWNHSDHNCGCRVRGLCASRTCSCWSRSWNYGCHWLSRNFGYRVKGWSSCRRAVS